jgi:hypothetical protein
MVSFKGTHFEKDMILTCVRWYVAYPLSYRQLEELMQERGVSVDHSTINRWMLKYSWAGKEMTSLSPPPVVPGNLYLLKYLTFSFYPVTLDPCCLAD